jgi:hypothetical protein
MNGLPRSLSRRHAFKDRTKGLVGGAELLAEIEYRAKSGKGKVPRGFSEQTYELGTRRPKLSHRDWHHIRHGGWRLPCDTVSPVCTVALSDRPEPGLAPEARAMSKAGAGPPDARRFNEMIFRSPKYTHAEGSCASTKLQQS